MTKHSTVKGTRCQMPLLHLYMLTSLSLLRVSMRRVTFAGLQLWSKYLCVSTLPRTACFPLLPLWLSLYIEIVLWEGWGPPGWQCFCPSPWCHLRVPQYTLGFCCLQKHTKDERVPVPTPQWQTQESSSHANVPFKPGHTVLKNCQETKEVIVFPSWRTDTQLEVIQLL